MTKKITAAIIGVTGYTGLELLRLLAAHPHVEIGHLTSRQHERTPIGDVYPHLSHLDLAITNTDHKTAAQQSDVVFLALPHKTAQDVVADLHGMVKVIDLSADYRLDDADTYTRYYDVPHNHPGLLKEVVYGLPEITGYDLIKKAKAVANPGCFAALIQYMLYPFKGHIKHADIIAVTGSSGSGKSASDGTHHPIRSHNMKSYNVNTHRHIPEITRHAGLDETQLNFVPTSGPFVRGIFAQGFVTLKTDSMLTLSKDEISPPLTTPAPEFDYVKLRKKTGVDLPKIYADAPFVRFTDNVQLAHIVGSNFVDLHYTNGQDGRILIQGALDNLVKGAAGMAIQNMNIMCGFSEDTGLANILPVYP
jgi:N-acetyl-gamma-glutamyl-phosphate reductase